jgi:hypothetical protein
MIRRSTWITLVIFVLLVGFTLYWTYLRPPEQVMTEPAPIPESPWNISVLDIERLEITNAKEGKVLILGRSSAGSWVEIAPKEGPVDSEVVENSVSWLASPRVSRVLSTEGGLNQFGLDEPSGIIKVLTLDSEEWVLFIGNDSPTGNHTYTIVPNTFDVLLIDIINVNSIMDLVGIELLLPPLPEETQTDMGPEVP